MSSTLAEIKKALEAVKRRIDEDAIPCLNQKEPRGGYFSTPLVLFSFIDCLAFVWKNPPSLNPYPAAAYSVHFLRKYLGKVNAKYRKMSGVIYEMFRHPLTHFSQPASIRLRDGRIIKWAIGKSDDSASPHLENLDGALIINIFRLMEDLKSAIDHFGSEVGKSKAAQKRFLIASRKMNLPRNEEDILKKKYIRESDFDFIRCLFH